MSIANQNKCPKCGVELEYYHGFLGYEDYVCPKCGYSANEKGIPKPYNPKKKKRLKK